MAGRVPTPGPQDDLTPAERVGALQDQLGDLGRRRVVEPGETAHSILDDLTAPTPAPAGGPIARHAMRAAAAAGVLADGTQPTNRDAEVEQVRAELECWRARAQDQLGKRIAGLDTLNRAVAAEARVTSLTERLARVGALAERWRKYAATLDPMSVQNAASIAALATMKGAYEGCAEKIRAALADPADEEGPR